jgi:glycerol-3-phosphate dehydrogenase
VVQLIEADAALCAPLHPSRPEVRAELVHAIRNEMALRLEDWFLRRTRIAFAPGNGIATLEAAATVFAAELGWTAERRAADTEACLRTLRTIAASGAGPGPSRT